MPIYEYSCEKCEKDCEILRKFKDADSPYPCPNCGSENLVRKQISLNSFQLVGSGWYKDGYSSKKGA